MEKRKGKGREKEGKMELLRRANGGENRKNGIIKEREWREKRKNGIIKEREWREKRKNRIIKENGEKMEWKRGN